MLGSRAGGLGVYFVESFKPFVNIILSFTYQKKKVLVTWLRFGKVTSSIYGGKKKEKRKKN